jgi:hypothetical protein
VIEDDAVVVTERRVSDVRETMARTFGGLAHDWFEHGRLAIGEERRELSAQVGGQ